MYFDSFDPLKKQRLEIMDKNGKILHPELMPKISNEKLMKIYNTMAFTRMVDTKTLQFQRQGRMLTYAPNIGQEASQTGTIAATEDTDWLVPAFRELAAYLYRGFPLKQFFLYWYGTEKGMQIPDDIKMLPISVPIASQYQHAAGIGYSIKYKKEKDISIVYVGDGGTSQGDFHEALNFASLEKVPTVFIVQNNQYAISTSRKIQTNSATIAQKAIAYDMPGIQVDGNDIFAVYGATKEAVDRARAGNGPSLIECFTYRLGAHTTADDPTIYRDDKEVKEWEKKDPILRLKKYLISQKLFTEKEDKEQNLRFEEEVKNIFEGIEATITSDLEDVFDYMYAERTPELQRQYEERKAYYDQMGK